MADNEVAVRTQGGAIGDITQSAGFYSSLPVQSRADKMALLRAINNSEPLLKQAGNEIAIVDVVMQTVDVANQQTGELEAALRVTLIVESGEAYHATSKGIAQSLKQVFGLFGEPQTWEEPLVARVVEEEGRNRFRYLTLKF